jgi:endonuclease/exonuclease/phosphatase family metal-dependent hydrolase
MAWSDTLTLVTLNTWKNGGDYPRRLALMGEQLAALAPDLVVLQEVFVAPGVGVDTADSLATALAMDSLHAPARAKPRPHEGGAVDSSSGLAVMTRLSVDRYERLSLPPDPDGGERVALIARMRWNGLALAVVNLHLTYEPDAHDRRCEQVREIVRALRAGEPTDAVVLAGDFNAEPESDPLRWLREASGFSVVNAWEAAGGPQPTMTEPPGSTTLGARCVDHIMLLQPPRRAVLEFAAAGRVLDRVDPHSGILPSDHAGLRAALSPAV